jgi:hypothetical protein
MKLPGVDRLGSLGLVGERKALALLCLGFYCTLFFLSAASAPQNGLPEYVPLFVGLMTIYLIGFFGVAAEWFWGRWFAVGLGYWGLTMTAMAFVQLRMLPPAMVIFGSMHGLISLSLLGEKMAASFDAKPGWRERWKLDEQGVIRVKKSVTRAASSLPALVLFALAPRTDESLWQSHTAALTLGALALFGLGGLLLSRTWGVLVLFTSGVACLVAAFVLPSSQVPAQAAPLFGGLMPLVTAPHFVAVFAGAMLVLASTPFARPMTRFLRR